MKVFLSLVALATLHGQGPVKRAQADLLGIDTLRLEVIGGPRNPWAEPSALFGVLGILGGMTGVLLQRYWHRRDEDLAAQRADRERIQAHVFDSLKWFEGKAQKRSIGIAVIEGNWDRFTDMHTTWAAVLVNQAVYLLAESGQEDAQHEIANFDRIKALLSKPEVGLTSAQAHAIAAAVTGNVDKGRGLRGLDQDTLREWRTALLAAT